MDRKFLYSFCAYQMGLLNLGSAELKILGYFLKKKKKNYIFI